MVLYMSTHNNNPLTEEEKQKYEIIKSTIEGDYTNTEAAERLGLSVRQIRRLRRKVETYGIEGIRHGLKGSHSHRKTDTKQERNVVAFLKKKDHRDFGPTFATEKLEELEGIILGVDTVRRIMIDSGLWKSRQQRIKQPHRQWREPMARYGELIQYDGSYHDWNEDGTEECLLQAIDDATGRVTLVFDDHEGVFPTFRFWWAYFERNGLPVAIYLDNFGTYKVNHKSAQDNKELISQFERAMRALGVRVIHAHAPEAKGRVERGFGTHQDRLVKELRLAKKKTREEMNAFMTEVYTPTHNQRFGRAPRDPKDAHRPLTDIQKKRLSSILSVHHTRVVQNDFTIQFHGMWFQLDGTQTTTVYRTDRVIIEERLDGTIHLRHTRDDSYLSYFTLTKRPKTFLKKTVLERKTTARKPPGDHPWRRF